jgi:hypothetical protein
MPAIICARCHRIFGPGQAMALTGDKLDSVMLSPDGGWFYGQSWSTCLECIGELDPGQWTPQSCIHCDRPLFTRTDMLPKAVACNRLCLDTARAKERRRSRRTQKTCLECGRLFTPKRTDSRYCSAACKTSSIPNEKAQEIEQVGSPSIFNYPHHAPSSLAIQEATWCAIAPDRASTSALDPISKRNFVGRNIQIRVKRTLCRGG